MMNDGFDRTTRAPATAGSTPASVPSRAGVGLKGVHAARILDERPKVGFFEVHAENYMVAGGPRPAVLEAIRTAYPLSIHGVGLSLGGAARPDAAHLAELRALVDRFEPGLVSEHIAWSAHDGTYYADLLPLPLTEESLGILCAHVDEVQDALGRRILIENPANYLLLPDSTIPEPEFITAVAERTGCGLLIDVNNIHVSACNTGIDPLVYLDRIPADAVGEIHVAGFVVDEAAGQRLLIDNHGSPVSEAVWRLFDRLVDRVGPRPTIVERDNDIPEWPELYREARIADRRLLRARRARAA
jgi:uncharacterized protein (UPF0276 family)